MGGLFSSLQTASAALQAFTQSLGVDQANVANASTPGYAAQKASIKPISDGGSIPGGGSDFINLTSSGDSLTDAIVRQASSEASASGTASSQLSSINQVFDITGSSGILAAFQQFSTAFSNLSVTPNDPTLGASALNAAGQVASAFNSAASALNAQASQVDSSIQSTVNQINTLGSDVQKLNVQIRGETQFDPGADASLRSDLDQLSSLVDITVTNNADGTVNVLAGGQLPVVTGDQAWSLSANPSAAAGSQITSSAGGNSPATFSGSLGALLGVRNGAIAQLLGSGSNPGALNELAKGFAARVNNLLSAGTTAAGASGVPIFSFDQTNDANVAGTLTLISSVTPAQLGLASAGPPAVANGVANQLAALPSSNNPADQIGGLSAEDLFGSIAASIGQLTSDAQSQATTDQTTLTSAQAQRQQTSGVSLDQEAVSITASERAYEASARLVSILDQLTSDEVNILK